MKTVTGNEVRRPLSAIGSKVNSLEMAVKAIGFRVISEPARCSPRIAALSGSEEIANTKNLYRSDNGFCLGQHTPQFSFFQPEESMEILESARQLINGQWLSAHAYKGGKALSGFIGIDADIVAPSRGDRIGLSVGGFDRLDGNGLYRFQLFANVLACNNGMTGRESLWSFTKKHTGNIAEVVEAMRFNLGVKIQEEVEAMRGTVNQLDLTPMTRDEVVTFATRLFPAKDENDVSTKTENMRESIVTGFSRGTGNVGRTRWDAFNAVTEYLDWNSTNRETDFSREENRFESLTSGNGAKTRTRALELLLN